MTGGQSVACLPQADSPFQSFSVAGRDRQLKISRMSSSGCAHPLLARHVEAFLQVKKLRLCGRLPSASWI